MLGWPHTDQITHLLLWMEKWASYLLTLKEEEAVLEAQQR